MFSLLVVDYHSIKKSIDYIYHFLDKTKDKKKIHPFIIDNSEDEDSFLTIKKILGEPKKEYKILEKKVFCFGFDSFELFYVQNNRNEGYARGNNIGFEIAQRLFDDEYIIVSNNDIRLVDDFNPEFFDSFFKQNEWMGVIGPQIQTPEGIKQSPYKQVNAFYHLLSRYWILRLPLIKMKGDRDYTGDSKRCLWVSGCFMIIRTKALKKVNGFDNNTFLYAEELILSERMKKENYYFYFYNDYCVIHEHGNTISKHSTMAKDDQFCFDSLVYYYQNYKNVSQALIKAAKINFKIYLLRISVQYKLLDRIRKKNDVK